MEINEYNQAFGNQPSTRRHRQKHKVLQRRVPTLLLRLLLVCALITPTLLLAQKQKSSYTVPGHQPVGDGDVYSSFKLDVTAEEDPMEGYNRLDVTVNVTAVWDSFKYQGKLYSIEDINKRNAIPDPHFDAFVFDKDVVVTDLEFLVVLNDGQHFTFTTNGLSENIHYEHLELREGRDHTVKMVSLTNSPKNQHVYKTLSHVLCNANGASANNTGQNPTPGSQGSAVPFGKAANTQFEDPWALGKSDAYFDPAEVIKADITDLFKQMAEDTGNPRLQKVADNCENVRSFSMAFKAANPDYLETIGKIENYSMLVGILAPFIFNQNKKPTEDDLRRDDLTNIREHDARLKAFEKKIMVDVMTVKEEAMKLYALGEYDKFAKYFKGYMTLLNTPIAMYDPQGLMYNFYSDLNRNASWETNRRNNPMSPALEKELAVYNYNVTVGELYYGYGKKYTAKKTLDLLIYASVNPNTKDEDILRILQAYPLYKNAFSMFDYQPYLFAMNYAHNNDRTVLFENIWKNIDGSYNAMGNTVEEIQASEKSSDQKQHLKTLGYTIIDFSSIRNQVGMTEDGINGLINSMSYSILKRRYDLLKGIELNPKYDFGNIVLTYTALDIDKAPLRDLGFLIRDKIYEAYLLQMMMENLYGTQEEAIRIDDEKMFLSVMREGMSISKAYTKKTNGENAKEKNNSFKPTYHNEVNIEFISSYDYVVNAKGYATLSNALSEYFLYDGEYFNLAFLQDSKMINGRIEYYNAWAEYYRTGNKSDIQAYKAKYKSNPYVIFEWLVSFGIPVQ